MNAPHWLRNVVIEGLQMLVVLRLRGAPANDTAKALANAWVAVLVSRPIAWDVALDLPRIRQGFLRLAGTCEYWPAPATFLEAMPAREPVSVPMLDAPRSRQIPPEAKAALDRFLKRVKT